MEVCSLCRSGTGVEKCPEAPVHLCEACRRKLEYNLCVVCSGCHTAYWLPKTPVNVYTAAQLSGRNPVEIIDAMVFHLIPACRGCYAAVQEFVKTARWTN